MDKFHWAVDRFKQRDRLLFATGWIFHEQRNIVAAKLVAGADAVPGRHSGIPIETGKAREDLASTYPAFPQALSSGFLLLGMVPANAPDIDQLFLTCRLDDGSTHVLPLFGQAAPDTAVNERHVVSIRLQLLRRAAGRLWHFLRTAQFRALLDRFRKMAADRVSLWNRSEQDLMVAMRLTATTPVTWWIDHDLGGGANQYRRNEIARQLKEGRTIVTLSFSLARLLPTVTVQNGTLTRRCAVPDMDFAIRLAQQLTIDNIIFNDGVSFPEPECIADFMISAHQHGRCRLTVLIHDYFMICPSQFLLDKDGVFCDVPDVQRCATCLPDNRHGFIALLRDQHITGWRQRWGKVLDAADTILAFSRSSEQLVRKAYPALQAQRIRVVPHVVRQFTAPPPPDVADRRLRIGVAGHIGYHKGARIVRELAQAIRMNGTNAEIVIFGHLDGFADPEIIRQTGPYRNETLPQLIGQHQINLILFPSIVPETFSYVLHELVQTRLPIACFNLGAQAECLLTDARALILPTMDANDVLQRLVRYHRTTYFNE